MTEDPAIPHSIAILATGDEISNGDILNSNSQEIAARLFNHGMSIGMHMVAGDKIPEITKAILFLLQNHNALIITGGLGPTSDDLTRYALADTLKRDLIFEEKTWDSIVSRIKKLGYTVLPQSNRQQALFPAGAAIIPNENGTAGGCMIRDGEQFIFMLPGPPTECLPMVDTVVIPTLIQHHFQKKCYYQKWLLFGVSEGEIAEELDALAKPYDCLTGYRLSYPYIEFKIYSTNLSEFNALAPKVYEKVSSFILEDGKKTASELLKDRLPALPYSIHIHDFATGGFLESILKTPRTLSHLVFSNERGTRFDISIHGLDEYWQEKNTTHASLEIIYTKNGEEKRIQKDIPFRGSRIKQYAVEFICREIYKLID